MLFRHSSGRGTLMWLQRTQLAGAAANATACTSPPMAANASSPTTRVHRHTGEWLARQCGITLCAAGYTHKWTTGQLTLCTGVLCSQPTSRPMTIKVDRQCMQQHAPQSPRVWLGCTAAMQITMSELLGPCTNFVLRIWAYEL